MLSGRIEDAVAEVAPAPTWAREPPSRNAGIDWKAVDRALRSIRRRRAALDGEEARWLREAERLQILRTQAKAALTGLGWKPAIAHAAVAAAAEAQGEDVTLERLIFEALRRCPKPKT